MRAFALNRHTFSIGAAAALLAACGGGSQPPIGAPGAMPQIAALAKDNGNLFVDDYGNRAVEIVTNGGAAPSLEGQLEAPGWNNIGTIVEALSNQPASNWVDKRGNLYVPDYNMGQSQVTEYTSSGSWKFTYSSNVEFPHAVTTDANGDVFEADGFNGINEYRQGSNTVTATCPQLGGGQRGVAVDAKGDVFTGYATSSTKGSIVEYSGGLAGCAQTVLGVSLGVPGAIVLDKSANLVVCDETNGTVDIIAPPYTQISGPFRKGLRPPAASVRDAGCGLNQQEQHPCVRDRLGRTEGRRCYLSCGSSNCTGGPWQWP